MPHPSLNLMKAPRDRRHGIWRDGVLQIWVTRACDKACFGCTQGSNLGGKPGMITLEQFEEACRSLEGYFGVIGIFGGNPCQAKGTKVYTSDGIFPIEDLENRNFQVRNLRGEMKPARCWYAGKQQLYEIKLRGGHSYFATANHEWPALDLAYAGNHKRKDLPDYCPKKVARSLGKLKTTELKAGMRLPVLSSDSLDFGKDGGVEDGFLAGWLLGDGWVSQKKPPRSRIRRDGKPDRRFSDSGRLRHIGMIVNKVDRDSGVAENLETTLRQIGSAATFRAVKQCFELNTASEAIEDWLTRFGLLGKQEGLPAATWTTASEAFRKGLIDGLFSADGHVEISKPRGYARVRLTAAHEKLVRDVSALLGFYGIKTQVICRMRRGRFPNGRDYGKSYASWELSISNVASVERFARLFPLTHAEKNRRLREFAGTHKTDDVEAANIEIISVTPLSRVEDVWDIHVEDDTHCFQLAHCVTGNCTHPKFPEICAILSRYFPKEQRGLWSNKLFGHGPLARETFNPSYSNINVHLDKEAADEFRRDWPEVTIFGEHEDSRHTPPYVAMQDVVPDEEERWKLIGNCDINQFWSAMVGVFRGQVRGWFCEIAGAQAMLHQHEPDYPDSGVPATPGWWNQGMEAFESQVRLHCHACGIPLRGRGPLGVGGPVEQVSQTHASIYRPKVKGRDVQLVTLREELGRNPVPRATHYIQNSHLPSE